MGKIKLFMIDDHALFLAGLRSLLRDQPDVEIVGEASTGAQALKALSTLQPDVILLDLTLPDGSGIVWLQQILNFSPSARILVLTMHDDAALAKASLAHGAKGFVVKTAADTELMVAIRAVARGRTFMNIDLQPQDMGRILSTDASSTSPETQDPLHLLSNREREVFQLLAMGFTNQEIADRFELSVKTVETYRARIMEKYGFRTRSDIVRFAVECGLLSRKTDES